MNRSLPWLLVAAGVLGCAVDNTNTEPEATPVATTSEVVAQCDLCGPGTLTFTRKAGNPITERIRFAGDPAASYMIEIADHGSQGADGSVTLNGVALMAQRVSGETGPRRIEVPVAFLTSNELVVRLTGKPGSRLTVTVLSGTAELGPSGGSVREPGTGATVIFHSDAIEGLLRVRLESRPVPAAAHTPHSAVTTHVTLDLAAVTNVLGGDTEWRLPMSSLGAPGTLTSIRVIDVGGQSQWGDASVDPGAMRASIRGSLTSLLTSLEPSSAVLSFGLTVESHGEPATPSPSQLASLVASGTPCATPGLGGGWQRLTGLLQSPAVFKQGALQPGSTVVVLIPGWQHFITSCSEYFFAGERADNYLAELVALIGGSLPGLPLMLVDYPTFNNFAYTGAQLASVLDAIQVAHGVRLVLLGHSMGGLVAREAAHLMSNKPRAIITLATPHLGSPLAGPTLDPFNLAYAPSTEGKTSMQSGLSYRTTPEVPITTFASRVSFTRSCTPFLFFSVCHWRNNGAPPFWTTSYDVSGNRLCMLGSCVNDGAVPYHSAAPSTLHSAGSKFYVGLSHKTMKGGFGSDLDADLLVVLRTLTTPVAPPSGLLAHYPLDNHGQDASGNGFHGVVSGATGIAGRSGAPNTAMQFSGNAVITVPTNPAFKAMVNEMTLVFWVKRGATALTSGMLPVARREFGNRIHFLAYSQPGGFAFQCCSSGGSATGSFYTPSGTGLAALNDGSWHKYALVRKFGTGGSTQLYMDDQLVGGTYLAGFGNDVPAMIDADLLIGRQASSAPGQFVGYLDDVMIFNRALSHTEIQAIP